MTKRLNYKFNLHRVVIILLCLTLLVALVMGVSYFNLNNQAVQAKQSQETRTLAKQVAFTLAPLLDGTLDSIDEQPIKAILQHLTQHSRILDASVYKIDGTLIAQEGDKSRLNQRLTVNQRLKEEPFHQQIVEMINYQEGPVGFLRLTVDTQQSNAELKQANNTNNMLRLMILLATVIGMILAYALLAHQYTGWKKSSHSLGSGESSDAKNMDGYKKLQPIKLAKKKRPHKKKPYR